MCEVSVCAVLSHVIGKFELAAVIEVSPEFVTVAVKFCDGIRRKEKLVVVVLDAIAGDRIVATFECERRNLGSGLEFLAKRLSFLSGIAVPDDYEMRERTHGSEHSTVCKQL